MNLKISSLTRSKLWKNQRQRFSFWLTRQIKIAMPYAIMELNSDAQQKLHTRPIFIGIILSDDKNLRSLNHQYRKIDRATNILSFPMNNPLANKIDDEAEIQLGDLVFAYETIVREAKAAGKTFDHHITHLAIHGLLHLLGFDHKKKREAEQMEAIEIKILTKFNIENPYIESFQSKNVTA